MAKTPYVRFFWSDWIADTAHLDLMQLGAYMRLLEYVYQHGRPIPGDMERVYRICHAMSPTEQGAIKTILQDFFKRDEDPEMGVIYRHFRAEREIEWAEKALQAKVDGGKKGARIRYGSGLPSGSPSGLPSGLPSGSPSGSPDSSQSQSQSQSQNQNHSAETESRSSQGDRDENGCCFSLDAPPDSWISYAREARPDLNPVVLFQEFAYHWREGEGMGQKRVRWDAVWRKWVGREKGTPANSNKPTSEGKGDGNGNRANRQARGTKPRYEAWDRIGNLD